jgi:hypothetical protein
LEGNTEADYQDDLLEDIERLAITLHDNLSVLPPYYINLYGSLAEHDIIGFSYYQALSAGQEDDYIHTFRSKYKNDTVFWTIDAMKYFKTNLPDTFTRKESFDFLIGIIRMTEFTLPISTSHVVNEALDSWIEMYTGRDNKVNVEMESDYSYKIAVDIHEAIKSVRDVYIFDFESSSMWMILIRLKMMLIIHHITIGVDSVPIGTYLDFDMSQCRTDFKYTADNLSSSFRAFYASVNGYKFVSKNRDPDNVNTEKSPLFTV